MIIMWWQRPGWKYKKNDRTRRALLKFRVIAVKNKSNVKKKTFYKRILH